MMQVNKLFKTFWDWRLEEFPEFGTLIGVHSHDGKLQSYSLESIESRKKTIERFLKEARELLQSDLKNEDKLNLQYFISDLNIYIAGADLKGYYFPISYLDGVHIEFERVLSSMKQHTEEDYLKILQRLNLLPKQISEIIEIMRGGMKHKMTFNLISVSGILKQLELLQVKPEDSCFFKPFMSIPADVSFSNNSKAGIIEKAKSSIEQKVLPSFKKLHTFLKNEYFKYLRPAIAISSLKGGKLLYQACLDYHLSCSMSPEAVHQMGLSEVCRIKKKMEDVIESLELKMSLQDFANHLRNESDFSFNNVEELLDAYKGAIFNQIEPELPKFFNYIPKSKVVIETFPSSMENAVGAYYFAGPADGSRPGKFLINASNLKASPKYDVMTLALHEALPGHHLQIEYLIENENIPDFRRFLEDRRYTEAPSLFPLYTAYVEGWALYCEYLGYELGLYDDAYLEFGHLSYEMLRACRLVVDTGIHAFGWSQKQAVEYMMNHTALHRSEVENEVNRYITWPGQACGYKVGELKIKSLREKAEKALGSKFDIKEFHSVVLESFGPLDILEQNVLKYIELHKSI